MSSNVYCPFCGIILLPDPPRDDSLSLRPGSRPWYAEVRGIYPTDTPYSIGLTGLGITRCRNTLYAPLESHGTYSGMELDALEVWKICELSAHRWCFGFHDSCWNVLLLRLGNGQEESPAHTGMAILKSLFDQLYCTPCFQFSSFEFGHDYEGAAQTHKLFGRIKPIDLSSQYYADPCVIPSTKDLESIMDDFLHSNKGISVRIEDGTRASTLFQSNAVPALFRSLEDTSKLVRGNSPRPSASLLDKLSAELSSEILSYLSFAELLNLRLVCRGLALLASTNALSQSYWRSRFCIGQEADFLFLSLTETRNWARLFMGTSISLKNKSLHLINRKRIRKLLEPFAALWDLEDVLRSGPDGSIFHPAQENDEHSQYIDSMSSKLLVSRLQIGLSFSGQLPALHTDGPIEEGCRGLYHRAQSLMPPHQPTDRRIGISTIKVGTRSFISGINLYPATDNDSSSCAIGYRIPASEKWVEIPPFSELRAIRVAFRAEGLTGVKFVFEDSESFDWVGDTRSSGIAFGVLAIQKKKAQICLISLLA